MESVDCLFCDPKYSREFWHENGYTGKRCDQCGLIYQTPRPTEQEMKQLYEENDAGGVTAPDLIRGSLINELVSKYIVRLTSKYVQGGSFLDIGAGGGQLLLAARDSGFTPHAVEINSVLADHLRGLDIEVANSSASSPELLKGRQFDAVCHRDIMGHLHDPRAALHNIRRLVKPGGVMIMETGNYGDISDRWLNAIGKVGYPEHVYLYSTENLKQLVAEAGFDVLEIRKGSRALPILLHKLLTVLKGKRSDQADSDKPSAPTTASLSQRSGFSRQERVRDRVLFFLKYTIGGIFPERWPATQIFVARPTEEGCLSEAE